MSPAESGPNPPFIGSWGSSEREAAAYAGASAPIAAWSALSRMDCGVASRFVFSARAAAAAAEATAGTLPVKVCERTKSV